MRKIKLISALLMSEILLVGCTPVSNVVYEARHIMPSVGEKRSIEKKNEDYTDDLTSTYKIPGVDIVFDVPAWDAKMLGHTQLYLYPENKFLAITAIKGQSVEGLQEAHKIAIKTMQSDLKLYVSYQSLDVKERTEGISDTTPVYYYEGELNGYSDGGTPVDEFVAGYSFIQGEYACSIVSGLLKKSQEDEDVQEIRSMVDQVMLSMREDMETNWLWPPEMREGKE